MNPEITKQEAKELLSKLGPAIYSLINLKHKFPNEPISTFQLNSDAIICDIIKTICFETGVNFNPDNLFVMHPLPKNNQ